MNRSAASVVEIPYNSLGKKELLFLLKKASFPTEPKGLCFKGHPSFQTKGVVGFQKQIKKAPLKTRVKHSL